ncbi:MAG TPA: hypothetical protein IGS53_12700 [Leptolyngbyaceae cyanobacterium M33_DOE_097]|uniref:Uncharacterized protein n=1 Tax=Oscillatoriales cyanobacterium SpSt-418 TaxID=2282169 RepID=A0A7C3PH79_9CYAN|nr:hypothetical protein [Leptolyngbyaceae cyanobacterium M33_DOE_097]
MVDMLMPVNSRAAVIDNWYEGQTLTFILVGDNTALTQSAQFTVDAVENYLIFSSGDAAYVELVNGSRITLPVAKAGLSADTPYRVFNKTTISGNEAFKVSTEANFDYKTLTGVAFDLTVEASAFTVNEPAFVSTVPLIAADLQRFQVASQTFSLGDPVINGTTVETPDASVTFIPPTGTYNHRYIAVLRSSAVDGFGDYGSTQVIDAAGKTYSYKAVR